MVADVGAGLLQMLSSPGICGFPSAVQEGKWQERSPLPSPAYGGVWMDQKETDIWV